MTLILGANLSDRVQLSCDTRLTVYNKNGGYYCCYDNIIKTIPFNKYTGLSVAGTLEMAQFYYKELRKKFDSEDSITTIRNKIDQYTKDVSSDYFYKEQKSGSVCLLFGGIDTKGKKKINLKTLLQITKNHEGGMNMKEAIFQGITGGKSNSKKTRKLPQVITLPVSDIHVFSVTVNIDGYKIDDSKWGEFLAYGCGGITKESIPSEAYGMLEVDSSAGQTGSDNAKLVAIMKDIAKKNDNMSIGGSIVNCVISTVGESGVMLGEVKRAPISNPSKVESFNNIIKQKNNFYSVDKNGTMTKLIPFTEYKIDNKIKKIEMELVM